MPNKNPKAHMKAVNLDLDSANTSPGFLANEALNPYVRLADCSQVSDGASNILLVSEKVYQN